MRHFFFKSLLMGALLTIILTTNLYAQGKFVYTNNDRLAGNRISAFSVDANGVVTGLENSPFSTGGSGGAHSSDDLDSSHKILISERGPFLFASNDGDESIAVLSINPITGDLTPIEGSPFPTGDFNDDESITLALSPDERFLFATNGRDTEGTTFSISVFSIADNGALTPVAGSPFLASGRPTDMVVSPDGKFLFTSSERNPEEGLIVTHKINPDGSLSNVGSLVIPGSTTVLTLQINCRTNIMYANYALDPDLVEDFNGFIAAFHIGSDGQLTHIPGSPFLDDESFIGGHGLHLSPNGKFLFRSNLLGLPSISVFKINDDGSLSSVPGSPFTTLPVSSPRGMDTDREGKLLYVSILDTFEDTDRVVVFKINDNGSLEKTSTGAISGHFGQQSLAAFPRASLCKIIVPDDITLSNSEGTCGATVKYPAPEVCGFNCGPVICNPPSGSFFEVGTTKVTCTLDGSEAAFKITIEDTSKPSVFCPANISVSTAPGQCSAVVNFIATASDNCGDVELVVTPPSGSVFPKGTTVVHLTATDQAGNVSECSFEVTVNDTEKPKITCATDIVTNNAPGQCSAPVNYQPPQVSDNCPDLGAPVCNPPSGSIFSVGATNVVCSVTDAAGNSSQCSFKVTVNDIEPPSIICPANLTVVTNNPCDLTATVNYPPPVVLDNCPNNVTVVCVPPSGSALPLGVTNVNCTATDGGGNQAQCSFKITVFDVRLQDDSNPSEVILFNSFTGDYRICSSKLQQPLTGKGTVTKKGCVATLQHNAADRRVFAKVEPALKKGSATLQFPVGINLCAITDKDITNNTTICQ